MWLNQIGKNPLYKNKIWLMVAKRQSNTNLNNIIYLLIFKKMLSDVSRIDTWTI